MTGLWLVDGLRDSGSIDGVVVRESTRGGKGLVGMTFIEKRCAASAFFRLSNAKMLATDAERCCSIIGLSVVGDRQSISTTLGLPAKAYETITALSQLLPLSHLEIDIVLALTAS